MIDISLIIPYMNHESRYPLLESVIKYLPKYNNVEICIHELGIERSLTNLVKQYNIKYMYTDWNEIFHRAGAVNKLVRSNLCDGKILGIMDADVIISKEILDSILKDVDKIDWSMGHGEVYYLSKKSTDHYVNTGEIIEELDSTLERNFKIPKVTGASGGFTLCNKELFLKYKGMPEDFRGTWGREDNAFALKFNSLGYSFKIRTGRIYHLSHPHFTKRNRDIQNKILPMIKWGKSAWEKHIKSVNNNWGK